MVIQGKMPSYCNAQAPKPFLTTSSHHHHHHPNMQSTPVTMRQEQQETELEVEAKADQHLHVKSNGEIHGIRPRRSTAIQSLLQTGVILMTYTVIVSILPCNTVAFAPSSVPRNPLLSVLYTASDDNHSPTAIHRNRRNVLQQSLLAAMGAFSLSQAFPAMADDVVPEGVTPTKTESGLKYIDLEPGGTAAGYSTDDTPKYGQLCVISYSAYMKLPAGNNNKQKFDSTTGYIIKHGNGKMIAGLDEGLHTMKRGGLRRIIIPPKLGFVSSGLGPLPEYPWQRFRLNSLIDQMVAQRGGNLIYDVRLETFFDDEADQGYYEDLDILPEEREELELRLMKRQQGGGTSETLDAVGNDINISDRPKEKPIV
jgi:FKBP-type peptidyl-prolyl cis-trans isomerase